MKAGGEGQEGQDGEGERAEGGGAAGRPHHEGRHQAQAAQAGHHQGHHHSPREPTRNRNVVATLIKNKIKFSSYIMKF